MKFPKLKDLLNSSVYITPNFQLLQTRRYKIRVKKLISFLLIYTLFFMVVLASIFMFTPARKLALIFDSKEIHRQTERINELEKKILFLSHELETFASEDRRLKYAILLGTTDTIDTSSAIYDSLEAPKFGENSGGNILEAFRAFWKKVNQNNKYPTFLKPVAGLKIRGFDPASGHFGIDYSVKSGAPVYAAESGVVIVSEYTPETGYKIMINHGGGYFSVYKHCSILIKKERDRVVRGEVIALSGNSGTNTTGPHLHFEIWKNSKAVDPDKFLVNSTEKK